MSNFIVFIVDVFITSTLIYSSAVLANGGLYLPAVLSLLLVLLYFALIEARKENSEE